MSRSFSLAADDLLCELRRRGVRLKLSEDGQQIVTRGALDDSLRDKIRAQKNELIKLLEAGEGDWVFDREIDMSGGWVN